MKYLIPTALALVLSAAALAPTQAVAQATVQVVIGRAPPPMRQEMIPEMRRGYEWAPGYWNWNGRRHVWVPGHRQRTRHGHYYQQPQWQQDGERWQFNRGGWRRGDRDGDGVPNSVDRRPNDSSRN